MNINANSIRPQYNQGCVVPDSAVTDSVVAKNAEVNQFELFIKSVGADTFKYLYGDSSSYFYNHFVPDSVNVDTAVKQWILEFFDAIEKGNFTKDLQQILNYNKKLSFAETVNFLQNSIGTKNTLSLLCYAYLLAAKSSMNNKTVFRHFATNNNFKWILNLIGALILNNPKLQMPKTLPPLNPKTITPEFITKLSEDYKAREKKHQDDESRIKRVGKVFGATLALGMATFIAGLCWIDSDRIARQEPVPSVIDIKTRDAATVCADYIFKNKMYHMVNMTKCFNPNGLDDVSLVRNICKDFEATVTDNNYDRDWNHSDPRVVSFDGNPFSFNCLQFNTRLNNFSKMSDNDRKAWIDTLDLNKTLEQFGGEKSFVERLQLLGDHSDLLKLDLIHVKSYDPNTDKGRFLKQVLNFENMSGNDLAKYLSKLESEDSKRCHLVNLIKNLESISPQELTEDDQKGDISSLAVGKFRLLPAKSIEDNLNKIPVELLMFVSDEQIKDIKSFNFSEDNKSRKMYYMFLDISCKDKIYSRLSLLNSDQIKNLTPHLNIVHLTHMGDEPFKSLDFSNLSEKTKNDLSVKDLVTQFSDAKWAALPDDMWENLKGNLKPIPRGEVFKLRKQKKTT